jgi:CheY-like chemotaxis protein
MSTDDGKEAEGADAPTSAATAQSGDAAVGRMAHEMNNAVAYVITNLNLLVEEIERLEIPAPRRKRLLRLADESTEGAGRVSELIRRLKVLSWGEERRGVESTEDDTWDRASERRRVLVIDDEPYILVSVRRALASYDVEVAESGEEALRILEHDQSFDIILCDLVMGSMSGIDVYHWMGEHHSELQRRTVFMTAGAFTAASRAFLAEVRNPVLHKPFDTKTLRWILAQTARQRQA